MLQLEDLNWRTSTESSWTEEVVRENVYSFQIPFVRALEVLDLQDSERMSVTWPVYAKEGLVSLVLTLSMLPNKFGRHEVIVSTTWKNERSVSFNVPGEATAEALRKFAHECLAIVNVVDDAEDE